MKTLEYSSKRLARRISRLMKDSANQENSIPAKEEQTKEVNRKQEVNRKPVHLTQQVVAFLNARYDFRYNLLTEETEFRPYGRRDISFRRIDKRELNTVCLEAHKEGINCWDKDLQRYIYSTHVESYHPFRLFMDELPDWDGTSGIYGEASGRQSVMDKKFPYMDARTCRPVDGDGASASQQRRPDTYQ